MEVATHTEVSCYSITQVAAALGVSVCTVRRLIKSGELPAFRVGRQWRVSLASLQVFTGAKIISSTSIYYSRPGMPSLYDEYVSSGDIIPGQMRGRA